VLHRKKKVLRLSVTPGEHSSFLSPWFTVDSPDPGSGFTPVEPLLLLDLVLNQGRSLLKVEGST
jgi:hypothetical protein